MCKRLGLSACWNIGSYFGPKGSLQLSTIRGIFTGWGRYSWRRVRTVACGLNPTSDSEEVARVHAFTCWDWSYWKTERDQGYWKSDQWKGVPSVLWDLNLRTKRLNYPRRLRRIALLHQWFQKGLNLRVHSVPQQLSWEGSDPGREGITWEI